MDAVLADFGDARRQTPVLLPPGWRRATFLGGISEAAKGGVPAAARTARRAAHTAPRTGPRRRAHPPRAGGRAHPPRGRRPDRVLSLSWGDARTGQAARSTLLTTFSNGRDHPRAQRDEHVRRRWRDGRPVAPRASLTPIRAVRSPCVDAARVKPQSSTGAQAGSPADYFEGERHVLCAQQTRGRVTTGRVASSEPLGVAATTFDTRRCSSRRLRPGVTRRCGRASRQPRPLRRPPRPGKLPQQARRASSTLSSHRPALTHAATALPGQGLAGHPGPPTPRCPGIRRPARRTRGSCRVADGRRRARGRSGRWLPGRARGTVALSDDLARPP